MICKYCGTLVSDEMKFCTNCGKKMERKTSYCTNCGNIINFNSKFCNICGAPTIIAEKMKKIRVSKVYSLIMLAIMAQWELCLNGLIFMQQKLFYCLYY